MYQISRFTACRFLFHICIIRFVNNPLSKENLAIGLIMISNDKIFYKFSNEKIQLVNKINPLNFKLLDYTINKVTNFIKSELENDIIHDNLFSYHCIYQ